MKGQASTSKDNALRVQASLDLRIDQTQIKDAAPLSASSVLYQAALRRQNAGQSLKIDLWGRSLLLSPRYALAMVAVLLLLNVFSVLQLSSSNGVNRPATSPQSTAQGSMHDSRPNSTPNSMHYSMRGVSASVADVVRDYALAAEDISPLSSAHLPQVEKRKGE